MAKLSILSEFLEFLRVRKKFWLAPIIFFSPFIWNIDCSY